MNSELDLSYPEILNSFGRHNVSGRTESRAFLGWYLENYYRLDEIEAQDAICDGSDDKGIDGIYVNENMERIDVFQTKLYQNPNRTIGDTALKAFLGTIEQLKNRATIEQITNSTSNKELAGLLSTSDLATKVEEGFALQGFFVTNAIKDKNSEDFLAVCNDITVYDGPYLLENWVPPGSSMPASGQVDFQLDGQGYISYKTPDAEVYVASIRASQLLSLSGLESQELFTWNVRQSLGKTKVNKAIAESVKSQDEHRNFLLYHNGLTILAQSAVVENDSLIIDGYTVVNGCQSLSTLYTHRSSISDDLRLLTRIIRLDPTDELASKITRHSNNQNAISARDLQSNSTMQRRLQNEFRVVFGTTLGYEIKRGETVDATEIITNEEAARLLLAFDVQQPWACHQFYRLFDDLHNDIFGRPEVNATRIATLKTLQDTIDTELPKLGDRLFAGYTLTKFLVLYLVKWALDEDPKGQELIRDPKPFLEKYGREGLATAFRVVVEDLIVDLDAEFSDRLEKGEPLDYKRELKSASAVRALGQEIIPSYLKAIKRNRSKSFSTMLAEIESNN